MPEQMKWIGKAAIPPSQEGRGRGVRSRVRLGLTPGLSAMQPYGLPGGIKVFYADGMTTAS